VTKRAARLIMLLWAALPAGAIYSIWTGDLRPLGIGLVLFGVGTVLAYLTTEAAKAAAKARKADQ
jgi:hypothetical protein